MFNPQAIASTKKNTVLKMGHEIVFTHVIFGVLKNRSNN